MKSSAAVLTLAAFLPACYHVDLSAPPASAASQERIAAYNRLRPAAEVQEITVSTGRYGTSVNVESTMVLNDGTTVRHADDLLPVVDASSASARQAERSGSARRSKWAWMLGGTAVALGGMAYSFANIPGYDYETDRDTGDEQAFWLGMGIAAIGATAATFGSLYYQHVERDARRASFLTYDEGLRQTLQVCVAGLEVVACEAIAPSGPPSAAR